MGLRIGISRVAVVLKWGAIAWLALGALAFLIGLANKPASDLLLLDGLLFGLPGLIGLVLAYIVGGFATPDGSTPHRSSQQGFANQANDGTGDATRANPTTPAVSVPASPLLEPSASQEGAWKRKAGRFLAYGVSLAVVITVASLRGGEWAGYVAGEILVPLLLMALVLYFLPKGLAAKQRGNAYVAAGAVVALVAMGVGFEQYRASQEDTKERSRAMELLGPIMKEATNRRESLNQTYKTKIKDLHFENLLTPETLLSLEANADAQNRIRQYRLLADESEREYERDLSDMDQKIRALKGEPKWGPVAVTGYENSRTQMVALTTRASAIQREAADLASELLSFMSTVSRSNGAEVRDGKLVFREKSDLEKYNALMGAIAKKAKDEAAASEAITMRQQDGVKKMQEALR